MYRIGINALFLGKPKTGTGKYVYNTLDHLIALYPETQFIFYVPHSLASKIRTFSEWERDNVSIQAVDVPFYRRDDHLWKYLWERFYLPHQAGKDDLDVFWTPYHSTGQFRSIPHVMTVHDMVHHVDDRYLFNWRRRWYMNKADRAARNAQHLLTVSEHARKDIMEYLHIPASRITPTYLGPPSFATQKPVSPLDSPYFLYLGGFDVRKNVPTLLEAFAQYLSEHSSDNLILALPGHLGDSPLMSPIHEHIQRLQLEDYIHFPGPVEEPELEAYLYNAQALVYPSLYEGFGLPILEGMAAGIPVITSQFGSMAEISDDAALLTDTTSPSALSEALHTLLKDNEYQHALSHKGQEWVQTFSWERTARQIGETLHNI